MGLLSILRGRTEGVEGRDHVERGLGLSFFRTSQKDGLVSLGAASLLFKE